MFSIWYAGQAQQRGIYERKNAGNLKISPAFKYILQIVVQIFKIPPLHSGDLKSVSPSLFCSVLLNISCLSDISRQIRIHENDRLFQMYG